MDPAGWDSVVSVVADLDLGFGLDLSVGETGGGETVVPALSPGSGDPMAGVSSIHAGMDLHAGATQPISGTGGI